MGGRHGILILQQKMTQTEQLKSSERLAVLKFPPASEKDHRQAKEEFEKIAKKLLPVLSEAKKSAMEIQDPLLRKIHMKEEQAKWIRFVEFYESNNKFKWWKINSYCFKNVFHDILNPKEEE